MDQPPNGFAAGGACRAGINQITPFFPPPFGLVSFPSEMLLLNYVHLRAMVRFSFDIYAMLRY